MSAVTATQSEQPEPDEALMIRGAQGDRAAFDVLCARHLPRLYVVALRLCADPAAAEEIAQDAMVRAWRNAARYDPARGRLKPWLNRIAVNLAIDRRRAARPLDALSEDVPETEPDALRTIESRDRAAGTRIRAGRPSGATASRPAAHLRRGQGRAGRGPDAGGFGACARRPAAPRAAIPEGMAARPRGVRRR